MDTHNGNSSTAVAAPAQAAKCPVDHSARTQASSQHSLLTSNSMTQKNSTPSKGGPVTKNPTRKEVDDVFSKFAGLIQASNRPIPNRYGDGRDHDATEEQQTGVWNDMKVLKKGGYLGETLKTLWMHMSHARKGGPVDDKTMIVSFCHA